MDNEIIDEWFDNSTWVVVKHRDKDGKFVKYCENTDDYETTYDDTKALIADLTSGTLKYSRVVEIQGYVDIDLIYEKLGNDFFGEDAIIFTGPFYYIYPSMDALMTPWKEDDDFPSAGLRFGALCNYKGPLDVDRLFSVDDFMFVMDNEFNGNWVKCERLDVNINYATVGFGQSDDHRYAFMNSKINQPIDKWKVDERCIDLDSWFANSEFNQPLNNWKLTKLSYIDGIFFRSKYNHPLDKWFSKPITLYATLAFAESECHQDLSMWKVNPDSVCDSMFYKSKYTIEEVSAWSWVKGLNQPVEDLFRLTMNSKIFYSWLFTNIDLAYKMNNEITVKYFDKNGRFKNHHDDYYTVYKNIDELVTALASGEMEYDRVVVITTRCDIQLIYDKLGHDFFGDDAIIFTGNKQYTIYPNMDALLTKCDEDDYFIASHTLSHLCSIEGPLDEDMLFSADGFICVLDGEFDKQTYLDVNINYPTVGFGEGDDHRYVFMNSSINQPIDKWLVDEKCISLVAWFANSLFNQPLNNWKLTKLDDIGAIFFRSKYNHPLDKWFSKPITISAVLAFAESECHQDLSMWRINPDSKCDGMFYNSKYTIEEVSTWPWVKNLNQDVEDLFSLTDRARYSYDWLLNAIED